MCVCVSKSVYVWLRESLCECVRERERERVKEIENYFIHDASDFPIII